MTDLVSETPIVCTLGAADFKERLAWIADLNKRALLSFVRTELELELTYRAAYRDDVLRMVGAERECCAFLIFRVTETGDILRVVITAPMEARDAADMMFSQFLAEEGATRGCQCAAATALTVSAGALACGACCLAPALGLAMSGAALSWLERGGPLAAAISSTLVAAVWLWIIVVFRRTRRRPSLGTISTLSLATGIPSPVGRGRTSSSPS